MGLIYRDWARSPKQKTRTSAPISARTRGSSSGLLH